jgi:hypothetical protein
MKTNDDLKEKIKEMRKMLDEIEKQLEKNKMPSYSEYVSKGCKNVLGILNTMLKEDVKEYHGFGSKQIGDFKVDHNINIKFLDEEKEDGFWYKKKRKDEKN